MNARTRILIGLLGLVVLLLIVFASGPFFSLWSRLDQARTDLESKKQAFDAEKRSLTPIFQRSPRLQHWQQLSLPESKGRTPADIEHHLTWSQREYQRELADLFSKSNIRQVTITARTPDSKNSPKLNPTTPIYTRLVYAATGQASLRNLISLFQEFHRFPVLHEIRDFTITRPQTSRQGGSREDLDFTMTIEALIVNGAEKRENLIPASAVQKPKVLADANRDYLAMLSKNIFEGTVAPQSKLSEDRNQVLAYVRLTTTYYTGRPRYRWEAYLYDQAKGGKEKLLTTKTLSEFSILDRYENVVLEGNVVDIDSQYIVFQSGEKHYLMRLGEFLLDAMDRPVQRVEIPFWGTEWVREK